MTEIRVYGAEPAGPAGIAAVRRGLTCRCPRCGKGRLFGKFLKVAPECSACGLEFHHHQADDFPPYIVMFIVGHLLGYGIYVAEMKFEGLPLWLHALLWPTLAILLCVGLLQPVKGAVVGLQYALGMHGFGQAASTAAHRGRAGEASERRAG